VKIYVDADACPNPVKAILFKAALRAKCEVILVANQSIFTPNNQFVSFRQVGRGPDAADDYIAEQTREGDIVITADVPLADRVISNHGIAINPRGFLYTKDNIKQRLGVRNLLESLRSSGVNTGGPKQLSNKDIHAFANILDGCLSCSK